MVFGKVVPQGNGLSINADLNVGQSPGPGVDAKIGTPGNATSVAGPGTSLVVGWV